MDQKLKSLEAGRKDLRKQLSRIRHFIKGTVMECERTCGTPTCKCAKGQKHIAHYLSVSVHNKTSLIYLPRSSLKMAHKWSNNYKKVKDLIERLAMLNIEILKTKPRE